MKYRHDNRRYLDFSMTARSTQKKRRLRRRSITAGAILLLACAVFIAIVNILMVRDFKPYTSSSITQTFIKGQNGQQVSPYDCILVLGTTVFSDGTAGEMLQDRVAQGVALYKAKAAPVLLLTGDDGAKRNHESRVMRNLALTAGVPSGDIFMDTVGLSTYDSLYRARDIFGAKKIIIVTQCFHLGRALYIAQSLGLDAVGVASDPRGYGQTGLKFGLREVAARIQALAICAFKPEPAFLGPAIPLAYSGELTV